MLEDKQALRLHVRTPARAWGTASWSELMAALSPGYRDSLSSIESRKRYSDESNSTATCTLSADETFCYCQQGEHGEMVGCDNPNCMYQWFHLECLKLKTFPKSHKWYCPDCRKLKHNKYHTLFVHAHNTSRLNQ